MNKNKITLDSIAKSISGKIIGRNNFNSKEGFSGIFNVLNDSKEGDIVIRHWINEKGVEIANEKNVACIITENPRNNSVEIAKILNFPIIVVDKIEKANAFALKWTTEKFASKSKKIVISGTNGKSTTSHLIYHILKSEGNNVFTNTDSKSEFNTLIDPMISKLISEEVLSNSQSTIDLSVSEINNLNKYDEIFNLDYLVIEASEVQGWLNKLMKNHAYLMADALDPDAVVVTNVAMDHIGLVNSIDEVFDETSGVIKAMNKGTVSLNYDDNLVLSMENMAKNNVKKFFFSMFKNDFKDIDKNELLYFNPINKTIVYEDIPILKIDELPFRTNHFIQNIIAAISICITLNISIESIVDGVKSYKPLKRRFSKIHDKPMIIDDFAHNPEGIKATVKATPNLTDDDIWIICAIRGSRGKEINKINAEALAESISSIKNNDKNINLILSNSSDVVDNLNLVKDFEKDIFCKVLNDNKIDFKHFNNLKEALSITYNLANENDVILLIGAQGMDYAESVLNNVI